MIVIKLNIQSVVDGKQIDLLLIKSKIWMKRKNNLLRAKKLLSDQQIATFIGFILLNTFFGGQMLFR